MRTTLLAAALLLPGCSENPFVLQARAVAVCHHLPAQRFEVPARVREEFARLPEAMQHGLALERTFEFDVRAEMPPELAELMAALPLAAKPAPAAPPRSPPAPHSQCWR